MSAAPLLLSAAGVEILLAVAAATVMLADLFVPTRYRLRLHRSVIAVLLAAAVWAFSGFSAPQVIALHGFYVSNPLTAALKGMLLLAAAGGLAFSGEALLRHRILNGDFLALVLMAVLGMAVMVSAAHLLSLYLGLELMSLCLYALIGMRRNHAAASEAAVKYFVLGALASGLFLYGVSMIYGATGQLEINAIATAAVAAVTDSSVSVQTVLVLGLIFMLAGMAFKLGAAPFHMWLPDVYHGAPAPVTLFIAAAPKLAALAMLLRVLSGALDELHEDWRQMIALLAVASLVVGNIAAIAQSNLKRMLAYSAIAHSGFLLLGVLVGGVTGTTVAAFYVTAYALMTVGGFGIITLLTTGSRERAELDDMKGMAARNVPLAVVAAMLMLSMAGVPPFVGFIAKFIVLEALVDAGFVWLAVIAVVFSLIGAFYYLRVIRLMFFDSPGDSDKPVRLRPAMTALLAFIGLLVLWFGVFPGDLIALFESAAERSVGY